MADKIELKDEEMKQVDGGIVSGAQQSQQADIPVAGNKKSDKWA